MQHRQSQSAQVPDFEKAELPIQDLQKFYQASKAGIFATHATAHRRTGALRLG